MYISTKSEILCSFVSRYYDPTFIFISLRFLFHFCRAVTKSRGPGIFPGYCHRKQKEIEPEELPIAYTRQLEKLATARWMISLRFLVRFVSLEFSVFVCVSSILNSYLYVTFLPDQRREKNDLLSFVDPPSPLSPLSSLISSPLSPKEGLILRLLRLRSESNSPSQPFYINHTIFL